MTPQGQSTTDMLAPGSQGQPAMKPGMSDPAYHQMQKLVREGLIGQPTHAECGVFRVGDWGERGMPIDGPKAQPGCAIGDWLMLACRSMRKSGNETSNHESGL